MDDAGGLGVVVFDNMVDMFPPNAYLDSSEYPGVAKPRVAQMLPGVCDWQTARYLAMKAKSGEGEEEGQTSGGNGAGMASEALLNNDDDFEPPTKKRKQRDLSREKRDREAKKKKLREAGLPTKAKKKKKEKKKEKKEKKAASESAAAGSGSGSGDAEAAGQPVAMDVERLASEAREATASGELAFSNFDFKSDASLLQPLVAGKKVNKRKLLEQAERAEAEKARLLKEGGAKGKAIVEDMEWQKTLKRVQGVKIKDNPKLLRKSIKRDQKKKAKSAKEWAERKAVVEKAARDKQAKRTENLAARAANKKGGRGSKKLSRHSKRR